MKLHPQMLSQMRNGDGFIAALDQSGGSTPKALHTYGIEDSEYATNEEMFRLVHEMRVRLITAPPFSGDKVLGAILFEKTMDGQASGRSVPSYLWEERGIVPFVKVDQGLEEERHSVQLLKPIPDLESLLARATKKGVFGTKMRSVIANSDNTGIAMLVRQQFDLGRQILSQGLVPIIEPEVLVTSPTKAHAESVLLEEVLRGLDHLPSEAQVIIKVSIPTHADTYLPLVEHPKVIRVVALSGGYDRAEACERLSHNRGMIASFLRALTEDLRVGMSDVEFNKRLAGSVDEIYAASVYKALNTV
ncbi:fructose bisphosphate aldolase [Rhizobium sp. 2MFCol3.1]|uniref:fructose bisphosphate aldolase n=1 Tax=Rhizobium sp. 2MFCol3.1 TaxID=1246459 RepID=UPI00039DB83F|nr:fructose bisphosphate aldolase [Rhizobium sp. 2MFCol3.1]